jgi:hypothetical protein
MTCTMPNQAEGIFIRLFVDEQQVGLEVALAMPGLFAAQGMIAVLVG